MTQYKIFPTAFVTFLIITSTSYATAPTWTGQMQKIAQIYLKLMPNVFDDEKFSETKTLAEIKNDTTDLLVLVSQLDQFTGKHPGIGRPDKDPATDMLAHELREELERAKHSLNSGDRTYARFSLRSSLTYCISCHTRSNFGPQFPRKAFEDTVKKLSSVDRMTYLSAIRQYDAALEEFDLAIKAAATTKLNSLYTKKLARVALSIAVRVKQDPKLALVVLQKIETATDVNTSIAPEIKSWREDVLRWQNEFQKKTDSQDLLPAAETLITSALKKQRYQADALGDISFLRASAMLHEYYRTINEGVKAGAALHLLGVSYERLRDLGFWSLHETYFDACIRKAPHSEIARTCYGKLKSSIMSGYTGSKGTDVPMFEQRRLKDLEELSAPVKTQ